MTKTIAFITQKGGAGKSTLSILFATHVHHKLNQNVLLLDCDYPQHSAYKRRQTENRTIEQYEDTSVRFSALGKKPYDVLAMDIQQAIATITLSRKEHKQETIFIDLPGNMDAEGYTELLPLIDIPIVPVEVDELSFTSAMMTVVLLSKIRKSSGNNSPIYLLWNKINLSEKIDRLNGLEKYITDYKEKNQINLKIMDTRVRNLVAYKDNRSTLFPYNGMEELMPEFINEQIF